MDFKIITNNPLVREELSDKYNIEYFDISYFDILNKVHILIQEGYKLLSHPLSGSVKPNETPYKSIMVSKNKSDMDYQSLLLIEKSIETYNKFAPCIIKYTDKVLNDFQYVDKTLIESAISSI